MSTTVTYTWSDLSNTYVKYMGAATMPTNIGAGVLVQHVRQWRNMEDQPEDSNNFSSVSGKQMVKYLRDGFRPPKPQRKLALPDVIDAHRPRWRFNDEDGDFDYDLYLSGEPEFYLRRENHLGKPGIRVNVQLDFNAWTPAAEITAYGSWVLQVLRALQAQGYDLEITVSLAARASWPDQPNNQYVEVVVSKFGEQVLGREWSAIFAPGGFRHLMFLGIMLPEIRNGWRIAGGLGSAINHEWDITWDAESRRLDILCDGGAGSFPDEHMTDKLAEVQKSL